MELKKVDIFGSFLSASDGPQSDSPAIASHAAGAPGIENEVLSLLANAAEPVSLRQLVANTSGSPTQTMKVLDDMEQFKLVEKSDVDTGARYTLTSLGSDLAPMA